MKPKKHVVCDGPFEWCKVIPFKVLCFIWRAKLGRIPSSVALKLRGVTVPSVMCGSCNLEESSSDHILLKYQLAKALMDFILFWCEVSCDGFKTVKDMLLFILR